MSLSGHAEIVSDRAHIKRLWTVLAKPWFPDGPDSSNLALLKFMPDRADYWGGHSSKMLRGLGMISSVIAGKPVGLGQLWQGIIAKPVYQQGIGHLMADKPNVSAAVLFYALFGIGLVGFAVLPAGPAQGPGLKVGLGGCNH